MRRIPLPVRFPLETKLCASLQEDTPSCVRQHADSNQLLNLSYECFLLSRWVSLLSIPALCVPAPPVSTACTCWEISRALLIVFVPTPCECESRLWNRVFIQPLLWYKCMNLASSRLKCLSWVTYSVLGYPEVTQTSAASNVPVCVSGKNNANELLRRVFWWCWNKLKQYSNNTDRVVLLTDWQIMTKSLIRAVHR